MASGSYLSGIVSGFQAKKDELEQRRWAEEQQNNQREGKIYEALMQSSDPEIQSMALSGLLGSANPKRKKGLQGWMGEMQKNPAMDGIKQLLQTPVKTQTPVQTGPPAVTGYLPAAPSAAGSAALPTSSPTAGGAAPPTPLANPAAGAAGAAGAGGAPLAAPAPQSVVDKPFFYTDSTSVAGTPGPQDLGPVQSDPRLATAPPEVGSITTSAPRQVFDNPEQAAFKHARGQAQGGIQGEIDGLIAAGVPPAEARATAILKMRKAAGLGAAPFQAYAGTTLDEVTGKPRQTYATLDKRTGGWQDVLGKPLTNFQRAPTGGVNPARDAMGRVAEGMAQLYHNDSLANLATSDPDAYMDSLNRAAAWSQENAGKTTTARKEAENSASLDKPIDPPTAQRTGLIVGTTPRDYSGQSIPTPESMKNEQDLKVVKARLQALIQPPDGTPSLLNILPSQHELIGKYAPGLVMSKRRVTNREEVARLEDAIANIVEPLQRAMGDPRISDKDIERASTRVASFGKGFFDLTGGDTRESALARIRQTLQDLDLSESNRLKRPTPNGVAPGTPPPGSKGQSASPAGPAGLQHGPDGKLYMNGQLLPGQD